MQPTCETCKFYTPVSIITVDNGEVIPAEGGHCRRYPPQLVAEVVRVGEGVSQSVVQPYFPYMARSEWCGEHRAREGTGGL